MGTMASYKDLCYAKVEDGPVLQLTPMHGCQKRKLVIQPYLCTAASSDWNRPYIKDMSTRLIYSVVYYGDIDDSYVA